ncbi:hypothetical protein [Synechocystis sp. LKSZ1]|uniref:GumC family protein n=1 Tax=Synechocystis sp. LKSZ1 TaxID=3144951 RepID=UPI00336BE895
MASQPSSPANVEPMTYGTLPWIRFAKYLVVAGLVNGLVWSLSLGYLKKAKPVYTSELVLNIAGAGQGVNVNLPDVGQAITSTTTAYGSTADPRENYKLMTLGPTVLGKAAEALDLTEEQLGQPKVKIINNTTMMEITITGLTPQKAQAKAWAIYNALTQRLTILRDNERSQRDRAIQAAVTEAQNKLTSAQRQLSLYRSQSGLNSSEQVSNLISSIEALRKQRAELVAQAQQSGDRRQKLSATLGLSPQQAAEALLLQTDQQFQAALKDYSTLTLALNTLLETRGENYPDVVETRDAQTAARTLLLKRGKILLGRPLDQLALERLSLDNSNGSGVKRSELFQQLVLADSDYQGLMGQLQALSQQIQDLEKRLASLTQKQSILDRRLRDLQIAEAIFTSTLAKVDLGKSDPYGSFPLLEIVENPSLPSEATAPKPKLVIAGSLGGSLLITLGLTLAWWRSPILRFSKKAMRDILA